MLSLAVSFNGGVNETVASNSNAYQHFNTSIHNAGGVDGTVAVTGSDFSTSTASSVTTGDSPTSDQEPSLPSPESNSDMLIVITGAVCGIVILLLLIAVTMLTLILVTKSRNNGRRYIRLEHDFSTHNVIV